MADPRPSPLRLPFLHRGEAGHPAGAFRVLTDFESGNVGEVFIVSPSHLRFMAPLDRSPYPLWFYFCIEGAHAPSVRCDLANADVCLGPRRGWSGARPVF